MYLVALINVDVLTLANTIPCERASGQRGMRNTVGKNQNSFNKNGVLVQ